MPVPVIDPCARVVSDELLDELGSAADCPTTAILESGDCLDRDQGFSDRAAERGTSAASVPSQRMSLSIVETITSAAVGTV